MPWTGGNHVEAAQRASTDLQAIQERDRQSRAPPADRQMEVCMQCHLETTSTPFPHRSKYDRGPFSYRPGSRFPISCCTSIIRRGRVRRPLRNCRIRLPVAHVAVLPEEQRRA